MRRFRSYSNVSEDSSTFNLATTIHLTPSQGAVAGELLRGVEQSGAHLLRGTTGVGKTTILRWLVSRLKGTMVSIQKLVRDSSMHPEWPAIRQVEQMFQKGGAVLIDDVHISASSELSAALLRSAREHGATLLFTSRPGGRIRDTLPDAVHDLSALKVCDFEWISRQYLGESSRRIDFRKVLRVSPDLNGHLIKDACLWLGLRNREPDTEALITYLRRR